MKISKAEVEHVAWLARLELTENEKEQLTHHLNQLMMHFEKLRELDTTGVEPTSHSIPVKNVFREDVVGESLPTDEVLSNAPDSEDAYFVVPQVVEM
jgi:aspartyl-tRNA(Asn)/glutamyl-tRNA(Gln) amidotransferase subunit C